MPKKGKGKGKKAKVPEEKGLTLDEFKAHVKKTCRTLEIDDTQEKLIIRKLDDEIESREKDTDPLKLCFIEPLETKTIIAFCQALREAWKLKFKILTVMCFTSVNVRDSGCKEIARCIKEVQSISRIELRRAMITATGCLHLSKALEFNSRTSKNLRILNLSYNDIGTQGVEYLSKGFDFNQSIEKLYLQYCNLTPTAGKFLMEMVKQAPNLQVLSLNGNNLQAYGLNCICQGLLNCQTNLTHLEFTLNHVGDSPEQDDIIQQTIYDLCTMMQSVITLNTIDLSGNSFAEEYGELLKDSYDTSKVAKLLVPYHWNNSDLYKQINKIASGRGGKKKKGKGKKKGKKKK